MIEDILSYLGVSISLVALFIVFWDHWKDDRLLTKRVQEFYEDIEQLIFSNYKTIIYTNLFDESRIPIKAYENEILNYKIQNAIYRGRVSQRFEEFSKYIGLTYYSKPHNYINKKGDGIFETGELFYFYNDLSRGISINKMKRFYDQHMAKYIIDENTKATIEQYLKNLRSYWEIYYKKGKIFRRKIHSKLNFGELLS